ncbi:MAG: hypothetical protein KA734_06190 [Fluviicola sp.]|nr:hypothetical protein [Fluviicola sp.]
MKTVQDFIESDLLNWLHDNNFKYRQAKIKTDKGCLENIYNDKFCLKIYDRLGHGFGVTINVADKYDESIYDNDSFSLHWAFKYFKLEETASFSGRSENQYQQDLPKLMTDVKNIISRLDKLTSLEWESMFEWISREARKYSTQN